MVGPTRIARGLKRRARNVLHPPPDAEVPAKVLARYVPAAPVVVEAGAHRGIDTVLLAKQWPDGVIHAFEPVPDLFAAVEERTRQFPNVRLYPEALSGETGEAPMWVSGGALDQASSLRTPKQHLVDLPEITFERQIIVPTVKLDDWAAREGVQRVDLFRLDLQGMELEALEGATGLLADASAVYTEVFGSEQYEGIALYDELRGWLAGQGWRPEIEKRPWRGSGNVLFVRA